LLTVTHTDKVEITVMIERISILNSEDFFDNLRKTAAASDGDIVIDMKNVISLDSSAIATLVKVVQMLSGKKRGFSLVNVTPEIQKVFTTLRISTFFKLT